MINRIYNAVYRTANNAKFGITIDASKTDTNGHRRPVFECVTISGQWPLIDEVLWAFVELMEAAGMSWWYGSDEHVHQGHGAFEVRWPLGSKGQFYKTVASGSLNSTGKTGGFIINNQPAFMDLVAAFMPQINMEHLQDFGAMPHCLKAEGDDLDRTQIVWAGKEYMGDSIRPAIYLERNGQRELASWYCEELGKWLPHTLCIHAGDLVRAKEVERYIRRETDSYRVLRRLNGDGRAHGLMVSVPSSAYVAHFNNRPANCEARLATSDDILDAIL